MKISSAQLRTGVLIGLFILGGLMQLIQTGQVLGVTVVRPQQQLTLASPTTSLLPQASNSPPATASDQVTQSGDAKVYPVVAVTDGDTFKVMIGDQKTTVRIVGINTPETVDPRRPVQCFGKEASTKLKELLKDQKVRLEADATQQNTDKYGRLLRFVFLEDSTDVGKLMIEQGFAHESLYSKTPHKYRSDYLAAQQQAQTEKRGLWGDGVCPEE